MFRFPRWHVDGTFDTYANVISLLLTRAFYFSPATTGTVESFVAVSPTQQAIADATPGSGDDVLFLAAVGSPKTFFLSLLRSPRQNVSVLLRRTSFLDATSSSLDFRVTSIPLPSSDVLASKRNKQRRTRHPQFSLSLSHRRPNRLATFTQERH